MKKCLKHSVIQKFNRNSKFKIRHSGAVHRLVWAVPVSLAATQGINCYSIFLWLLKCFTSPGALRAQRASHQVRKFVSS